jgi:lysine 2-monooxygenase
MTSAIPVATHEPGEQPFGHDDWLSGIVTVHELVELGLRPVVHAAHEIGGRLRSVPFDGPPGVVAETGAMRFPPTPVRLPED